MRLMAIRCLNQSVNPLPHAEVTTDSSVHVAQRRRLARQKHRGKRRKQDGSQRLADSLPHHTIAMGTCLGAEFGVWRTYFSIQETI